MSNGYENAPSTKMIATHCAYCARPLRRPDSVEAGVGPDCMKLYGGVLATGPADWEAARAALAGAIELPAGWGEDQARVASLLVHLVACLQEGPVVVACTNAIRALGYPKLAARITERLARIQITAVGDVLQVKTPFVESALPLLRRAPGEYKGKGIREIPNNPDAKRAMLAVLRAAFPGEVVSGPKGVFQLAA